MLDVLPYDTETYPNDDECYYDTKLVTWYCFDYDEGDFVVSWLALGA